MYVVTDDVLVQIENKILSHPPERGGALLGPENSNVISEFLLDEAAITTFASYLPSAQLTVDVRKLEAASGLELKGVIHSHPGSLNRPSGPDVEAVSSALQSNPHLNTFACPIVTVPTGKPDAGVGDHEHPLGAGVVSWYHGYRSRSAIMSLTRSQFSVLPIRRDSVAFADFIGGSIGNSGIVEIDGRQFLSRRFDLGGGVDVNLLFGFDYPLCPPVAILGLADGDTHFLDLKWSLGIDESQRLCRALTDHFAPAEGQGNPFRLAWRPRNGAPLTTERSKGESLHWDRVCTNDDVSRLAVDSRDAALARTAGLLPREIRNSHVVIAGAGSVGSYVAEQLVRSGVGTLTLIDPETVELPNISRASYRIEDVGEKKVQALKRNLLGVNPMADVRCIDAQVQSLGSKHMVELTESADLLVCTIDDHAGARLLNRFAYPLGKSAVFVGLYAAARGGEIIVSVPEKTACYNCATNFRRAVEQDAGTVSAQTDYGTGRLVAEVALGCDVHHVSSAAVKMALSLLLPAQTSSELSQIANRVVEYKTSYLLFGMSPDFFIFPAVFRDVPGQHAFQSVWAEVGPDPECTVCGATNSRLDPRNSPTTAPSVETLRSLSQQSR